MSLELTDVIQSTLSEEPPVSGHPMKIMVAMCDSNRGIGHKMGLPWPRIREDFEYYRRWTSKLEDKGKVIVHIRGRLTWLVADQEERMMGGVRHVVITSAATFSGSNHPSIGYITPSFEKAVSFVNSPPLSDAVESVWIMGGQAVYEAAIADSRLQYILLTRVFGQFPADVFFPPFEEKFERVSDPDVPEGLREDNGVRYQFEIYKRK